MKQVNKTITAEDIIKSQDWKTKNRIYLKQLQKFLDLADNIADEDLRKRIIYQMHKCDETLTKMIEEICEGLYNKN